ncbi:TonB-dependent receptor [Terriglobus roseus]|uniref:TonB-dependent Receptor Plug Domain n=1 Tax=Terriglobus roseus TaxID=392734 RepID=A0A1H4JWG2_9BACT|nr:TonB-dependent receptor [Terriglobus roseus]SEB50477.1 TonB-dependent Receptor Plug Domain [Terriglobus roseus]
MRKLLIPLVCLFVHPALCSAQFDTGSVLGTAIDPSGAYIPDAHVTIREVNKGIVFTTTTTSSGEFTFPSVPLGRYELSADKSGFGKFSASAFELTIGARQRVDVRLAPGEVQTAVTVTAEAAQLQTDTSDRGQTINTEEIRELPLNGRAYSELVFLSTGVVRSPSSYGSSSSLREGSFNVNGLRSTANNFLLDGIDNNYFGTSNQGLSNQVVQPPPDAIAEFRAVTNNASAEFGRAGGATVNASLRSGTNAFHGSVWEYFRNTSLNAAGYFKSAAGKPRLNRNQFGGTFGGPIWRDESFFFADYEGYREVSSSVAFASLPTVAQRLGQLGIPVKNPFTGVVYANGVIPAADIIRFASGALATLPTPTSAGISNNFTTLYRIQDFRNKGDVKIDHYFSSNVRVFGRYSQSAFNVFDPGIIPGVAGGNGNGSQIVPIRSIAGGLTWTINANNLLEVRMGYSHSDAGKAPPLAGGPSMQTLFGIGGLPTDPLYTGGISSETLLGFSALGRQATSPQFQHPTLYDPKVNYTRVLGRQTLKAGLEYQWLGVETLDVNPILGRDVYSGLFSAPAGASLTTTNQALYSLADFLFGARSQYQLVNPGLVHHRQQSGFAYVQDDWKVTPAVTLNLGLRYELVTPFYERDNLLSNYNPPTNSIILAKSGSIYDRGLVHMDTNNLAPRVGIAWQPRTGTVVHAGYGDTYSNFNRTGTSYLAYNGPRFVLATVTQSSPTSPTFRNTQAGYPDGFASSANFDPRSSTVQYIPADSPSVHVGSYYASVQQQLPSQWMLDLAYVGNNSGNLIIINDINQARPNAVGENTNVELRRPNQAYSSIAATLPYGYGNYNSLQARVQKSSANGLFFLNSFTWSKAMDVASQAFDNNNGNNTAVQDVNNVAADYGISNVDRPVNNVTSIVYQLPFGPGRRFLGNTRGMVGGLVGGWEANTIINARSGEPVTLTYTPNAQQQVVPVISVLGRNASRPNVLGNPVNTGAARTPLTYLNAANVSVPQYYAPFGNARRNSFRGYAYYQTDLGVSKRIPIHEGIQGQFRAEAFNLFNHSNFTAPDGNISNTTFGRISSTYPQRQLQFALKVSF